MRYRITHRTQYDYESVVSASFGTAHLLPRELPDQRPIRSSVEIEPRPSEMREHSDFFGNRALYFAVRAPHTTLTVTSTSEVEVLPPVTELPLLAEQRWEVVRDRLRREHTDDMLDARQYVLDSPLVTTSNVLVDYALRSFPPGRTIGAGVADLRSRIHADFTYKPGATSVTTTLDELLDKREGVCQDYAHFAIGCLRSLGLAARYVSGYLETDPPPGGTKLLGADVSHAWLAVFIPEVGWIDLDPTNDQLITERYVTTGWGRDYADVPPLTGVIFTEGTTTELTVTVDVVAT